MVLRGDLISRSVITYDMLSRYVDAIVEKNQENEARALTGRHIEGHEPQEHLAQCIV